MTQTRLTGLGRYIHTDKPLRGGAEDDRSLVPPAMRIAVLQLHFGQQATVVTQAGEHLRIGIPDTEPGQRFRWQRQRLLQKATIIAHRVFNRQPIFFANVEVIHAVRRGSVYQTRTRIGSHMFATNDRHILAVERMAQQHVFKRGTVTFAQHLPLQVVTRQGTLGQISTQNQVAFGGSDQGIFHRRMHADRFIRRQRPRGRRPNHGEGRTVQMIQPKGLGDCGGVIRVYFKGYINSG